MPPKQFIIDILSIQLALNLFFYCFIRRCVCVCIATYAYQHFVSKCTSVDLSCNSIFLLRFSFSFAFDRRILLKVYEAKKDSGEEKRDIKVMDRVECKRNEIIASKRAKNWQECLNQHFQFAMNRSSSYMYEVQSAFAHLPLSHVISNCRGVSEYNSLPIF